MNTLGKKVVPFCEASVPAIADRWYLEKEDEGPIHAPAKTSQVILSRVFSDDSKSETTNRTSNTDENIAIIQ